MGILEQDVADMQKVGSSDFVDYAQTADSKSNDVDAHRRSTKLREAGGRVSQAQRNSRNRRNKPDLSDMPQPVPQPVQVRTRYGRSRLLLLIML